jgi:guanylate kinase
MKDARSDMSHFNEFEYLVLNDQFEHALAELNAIVIANRCTLDTQTVKLSVQLKDLL